MGNRPIFCWFSISSSAYECESAAHENVSRRTEIRHPPYSMALMARGGEFSDMWTSRSLFLRPITTETPSESSSSSFRSTPPTHRQDIGLNVESGLSSGSEYMDRVLLHSTQALFTLGRSKICWTPGPAESLYGGSSLEAMMAVGSSEASPGSGGRRTKCKISAAEVPT